MKRRIIFCSILCLSLLYSCNNPDQELTQEEKDDIMDRIAQMQMDQILLDKAYNNAYLILSGQITFDELIVGILKEKSQW